MKIMWWLWVGLDLGAIRVMLLIVSITPSARLRQQYATQIFTGVLVPDTEGRIRMTKPSIRVICNGGKPKGSGSDTKSSKSRSNDGDASGKRPGWIDELVSDPFGLFI